MHEHITLFKQNPTQKFSKYSSIFKNPKKISKTQKPRLKCMKCKMKERQRDHTRGKKWGLGKNLGREDEWVEGKVFGREKEGFYRERSNK